LNCIGPAQRTGYRPGQVLQVDWAEMPMRPRIAGRERRVYALVCALPYWGVSAAHFSLEMTVEAFLEGHGRGLRPGLGLRSGHWALEAFGRRNVGRSLSTMGLEPENSVAAPCDWPGCAASADPSV
jgi:hypothetical protein